MTITDCVRRKICSHISDKFVRVKINDMCSMGSRGKGQDARPGGPQFEARRPKCEARRAELRGRRPRVGWGSFGGAASPLSITS